MNWGLSVLIAFDQLINALIGGYPDETLSASAYKGEQEGKAIPKIMRPLIDFIFSKFETDHCRKAYESELLGLQLPKSYRKN